MQPSFRSTPAATTEDMILFECAINSSKNIRSFSAAFTCLSKLGKEVSLEAFSQTRSLHLRQVNESKTSYVLFEFRDDFFHSFSVHPSFSSSPTAKLKLKMCLAVFRSLKAIDSLEVSLVRLGTNKHVVMFRAHCKLKMTKTHHFYYEDCEALDPSFDREMTKHRIRLCPKFFLHMLEPIVGQPEIDFTATAGLEVRISSVSLPQESQVNTEVLIPKESFLEFDISEPTASLTFSLRELKPLLAYCESRELAEVYFIFNDSGMPLMFTTDLPGTFHDDPANNQSTQTVNKPCFACTLILSTIPPQDL